MIKLLKFSDDLVPLILSGEKQSTWRIFDDKDLRVGDELSLVNQKNGTEFSRARILSVREKELGKIEPPDFAGHETYETREQMLKTYQSYYGDDVTWNTIVKMIDFELLK